MNGTSNLFVKEGFLHGVQDVGIHANSKLTNIASTFVSVQVLVDSVCVVGGGFHNLSVLEHKANLLVHKATFQGWCVIANDTVYRIPHRSSVHFSIRNIHITVALNLAHSLDGESEVGARSNNANLIGGSHYLGEGIHGTRHFTIVQGTHIIEEIFKSFLAHASQLSHGRCRRTKHYPASVIEPSLQVHRLVVELVVQVHFFSRHINPSIEIFWCGKTNEAIHGTHFCQLNLGTSFHLLFGGTKENLPLNGLVLEGNKGHGSHSIYLSYQCLHQSLCHVVSLNQNLFPRFCLH